MAKKSLQRYLVKIGKDFNVVVTEENYKDVILKELETPPSLLDYLRDYMEKNELTLEWGCLMFLFIRADEEKYVPDIESYYKLLARYPPNWFIEVGMAELELRYYGNIFKARDGFFKGLELRPDNARCHYNLGFIYHLLGVFNKSFEHYFQPQNKRKHGF
jgi:tetratricopeptide (TPR) repeat protein